MDGVICCDTCPFSPTCEEEEDERAHSYRSFGGLDPFDAKYEQDLASDHTEP